MGTVAPPKLPAVVQSNLRRVVRYRSIRAGCARASSSLPTAAACPTSASWSTPANAAWKPAAATSVALALTATAQPGTSDCDGAGNVPRQRHGWWQRARLGLRATCPWFACSLRERPTPALTGMQLEATFGPEGRWIIRSRRARQVYRWYTFGKLLTDCYLSVYGWLSVDLLSTDS